MRFRLLLVLALWAAIYLPWLGATGLHSEEPKRVMPAVEMLATGDFLVPRIAGEPFLRKPPRFVRRGARLPNECVDDRERPHD